MTIYEPNDELRPTGEEPAEFIPPDEPHEDVSDDDVSEEDVDGDPPGPACSA
jgi:hypothetical protein